jgi:lipoic acid synthetase
MEVLPKTFLPKLPPWLRPKLPKASEIERVQKLIKQAKIHTICEEGHCPNRGECYSRGTATFLLLGSVCTRHCGFCQVDRGRPLPVDANEPFKVAQAVQVLGLSYVVLTSVARDDLPDQGAGQFVRTIVAIRELCPSTQIEVLTPDFRGDRGCIAQVISAQPVCFNHNIETVRRLQKVVRRTATYDRSLQVLRMARELAPNLLTKSGLMLGHGETKAEVVETLGDLYGAGCRAVTIGQYLQPSLDHLPVQKYWTPCEFEELGQIAQAIGFVQVQSAPLVRSSYHAGEMVISA